jgi:hypothetical protein
MAFNAVLADQLYKKAAIRDAKDRGKRERVCLDCLRDDDKPLGGIWSSLGCQRCDSKPCVGAVVVVNGAVHETAQP